MTGQYYLRARYYNPVLGWLMQEDTYQCDGLNLYAYCKNNPVVYYNPSGYCGENSGAIAGDGDEVETITVGRWMAQAEYAKMIETGKVQMSYDQKVHVAYPANADAFGKQALKDSIYVEFDVPSNVVSKVQLRNVKR